MADHGDHGDAGRDPDEAPTRAIAKGLVALVAVTVSVGLVLGLVVLGLTRYLGVGDDESQAGGGREEQSLYLPKPEKTSESAPSTAPESSGTSGSPSESESTEAEDEISLQAAQTEVGSFEPIDLSGVYTGGEGAILRVQRFEGGRWADFDVTIPVSNETFTTYVQTAVSGVNRWRVVDTDTGVASNEVKVTVG